MTAIFDIRAAFRQRVADVPGLPTDRKWENVSFTPTQGTPWIKETFQLTSERQTGSATIETKGVLRFDLYYPADEGVSEADAMADAIKARFAPGTSVNGLAVVIRAERGTGREETDWYVVPVNLTWRAHSVG